MRQRGYGNRLMDMALQFCRDKGYKKVFLLTITAQVIARHVYETHGFYKVSSNDKAEWGDGVVEERWEVDLLSIQEINILTPTLRNSLECTYRGGNADDDSK